MAFVRRLSNSICAICMIGAATAVAGLVILILTEIVLRSVFSSSLLVTEEVAGYLVSAAILLALAPTFKDGAMIRLTLVSDRLGKRQQRALELCMTLVALGFALFWARYILRATLKLFDRGATSYGVVPFPLWLPEAVALFGVSALALILLFHGLSLLLPTPSTTKGASDHGI
ncbi:TRAP-type C4-dicarboxylate transport system, small permease component [Thalassovita litoralis]|uniref:TRAP transporter small permease protein n=1 Tax=Thalassovita litoralis TaxID=1010611 RepID=A0A521F2L5_9RHOB|nr:TRAP transporter small permease [Thalassovita litoralis]SMO90438.1 TRAP-type C4-dicarboxylate transport system, small permease component [Thalassovita litoralis]